MLRSEPYSRVRRRTSQLGEWNRMRAVQIERFGGPEMLVVAEISSPEPQGDEVVVGVEVAGVNGADLLTRAGL